ncbi:hypothetical protein NEMIN01_2108, partial [Nematocida minor]|uniref:uncharacterized protein n=1 Tax=Nematocida minor TaxID=1912983 RepID=UPI00222075A3
MILQRILKRVAIGLVALSYLQRANGFLDNEDIANIKTYWENKKACRRREFNNRRDFLAKARNFVCEKTLSEAFKSGLGIAEENLTSIENNFLPFDISVNNIANKIEEIRSFRAGDIDFKDKVKRETDELEKMVSTAFEKHDLLSDTIKDFDSHMIKLIEEYGKTVNKYKNIDELTLFKLAKKNKPFALDLVYTSFTTIIFKSKEEVRDKLNYTMKNIDSNMFTTHFIYYMHAITNDLRGGILDILILADKNLPILFSPYGVNEDLMNIYLNLVNKDISDNEIDQYITMKPGDIIKMIMLECMFNGYAMDHRRNDLFLNIGRIIKKIGRPLNNSTDDYNGMKAARERQDEILDALNILWNDRESMKVIQSNKDAASKEKIRKEKLDSFCKQNGIEASSFTTIQNGFISARWMYNLSTDSPITEGIDDNQELLKTLYFTMSYTHPMLYIYMRCEEKNQLVKTNLESNEKPFIDRDSEDNMMLRLYKISREDSHSVRAENMKFCIKAWFSHKIHIIYREKDTKEYYNMVEDFKEHLEKSQ